MFNALLHYCFVTASKKVGNLVEVIFLLFWSCFHLWSCDRIIKCFAITAFDVHVTLFIHRHAVVWQTGAVSTVYAVCPHYHANYYDN